MKTCFKCNRVLGFECFYKHPKMQDRTLNKCKDCTKRDNRINRSKKAEYYLAYDRQRFQTKERKEFHRDSLRSYRARNPLKDKAHALVGRAVKSGELLRKPCEVCGASKVEAHHTDYLKPLDVRWLCFKHHREAHGQRNFSTTE